MLDNLNIPKAAGIGAVLAIVGNIIVFYISQAITGDMLVTPPGQEVAEFVRVGPVVISTFLGAVVGLVLALIIGKFAGAKAASIFLGICTVAVLLYIIPPFTQSEEAIVGVWLNIMHFVAAIPIVGLLTKALRERIS